MKVLVTGAGGLVGRAVTTHCAAQGESVIGLDHSQLDITEELKVKTVFELERPDIVINCAAWTDVDGCELNSERAENANARGPEVLAMASGRFGAALITISTDYVFDGEKEGFYTQRDQPNPQSVYGRSKLAGERRAQNAWARTIVVRSGYLFGARGTNFLSSIIERARRGEQIKAISDSFGTPTYAPDLARQLYRLALLDLPGTYHIVNAGEGASFEEFSRRALETAGFDVGLVTGVSRHALQRPAPRPQNSRLRCLLSEAIGLDPLPSWKAALCDFVAADSPAAVTNAGHGSI